MERAWFCDHAEELGASFVEAEDKNTNMNTDKLHKNDPNLRRWLQNLDQSLSNAASIQARDQAHLNQAILLQNKPNFITNVSFGITEELLRDISKDYDRKGLYFEMPSSYLKNY